MVLSAVREVIIAHLPSGYEEVINWGMISYEVPLALNPKTYNGKPLMYAALASQKNHMALYLCSLNCVPGALQSLKAGWKGGRLDMGAACLRFRKLADLDLESIGRVIASTPVADYIVAAKR